MEVDTGLVRMYAESMKKKRCIICKQATTPGTLTCSDECAEALHWKQYRLNRHRKRSKVAGVYRVTIEDWQKILRSFNNSCAYCGSKGDMTIDHVVPLSRGGRHCIANLLPACERCNANKGNYTLVEWRNLNRKSNVRNLMQKKPWVLDDRMGVLPVRKRYKPHQTPLFSQMMRESYDEHLVARLNLTVDHFGVLK
jgi:5-methylcytosine-specific restriction endonuclease McrA